MIPGIPNIVPLQNNIEHNINWIGKYKLTTWHWLGKKFAFQGINITRNVHGTAAKWHGTANGVQWVLYMMMLLASVDRTHFFDAIWNRITCSKDAINKYFISIQSFI